MVADNEVDAQRLGVSNLLNGFDATVEDDNKCHTCINGIFECRG